MGKNLGGQPTKYKEDFARMAFVACSEAPFTDAKLAKLFDVSKSTINNWKHDHPEFKEALKKGKDEFDTEVIEKSFFKRCSGFYFNETTREPALIDDPKHPGQKITKMVVTKRVRKFVVPDAKGCMDWLSNRAPDRWRKAKHVEITGKDGGPVKTEGMIAVPREEMSIAQWEKEVREARQYDIDIEPGQIPGNA